MAHRSQSSSFGDNPLDSNYLPPHYREEYRLAIDALVEDGLDSYNEFLQNAGVVDFLSRLEIEHIKGTLQTPHQSACPALPCVEPEAEGSSDTYWPLHSDLDAPGLDLGWPLHHTFAGPTEVIMLVNPPDPEAMSIKERARKLIKDAQQVIAVVMDMFTDIDIFSDLLDAAARHVAVYILLDEQNAHHFVSMVTNCKVDLEMVQFMRVRTVAGTTYFCCTGKSFKGQVMDRFLLVDCHAVLSGNYSFMWSFEKIHRCLAHLFLGELVTAFDEEFRILYAQSQPLVIETALVKLARDGSGFAGSQFGVKRTQSLRHPVPYLQLESSRNAEWSGYGFGDRMDIERTTHFRREDPLRHTAFGSLQRSSGHYSQQFRIERSSLDQDRSIIASRQMQLEMNAHKRHSYAEGTNETYSSSRQFMKHRLMNNVEEMESHYHREQHQYQGGPGSGRVFYDKTRSQAYQQAELESEYPPDSVEPGGFNSMLEYLSSKDLKNAASGGRYNQTKAARPSVGQPYVCQRSPTQLHPPEPRQLFMGDQVDDPNAKQGLRTWRIASYLNAFENEEEEGLPQPLGFDAFDEISKPSEGNLFGPESAPRFGTREKIPFPRYGKPIPPGVPQSLEQGPIAKESKDAPIADSESSAVSEWDKAEELEISGPRGTAITKHESFRTRLNPMLQRSSRLRSSLIFSSSKLEQHSSLALKTASGLDQSEGAGPSKTTSIVAQILEKRRSISREPFEWSGSTKEPSEPAETPGTDEPTKVSPPGAILPVDPPKPLPSAVSSRNMNDPESRLLYFKELAAKRQAARIGVESAVKNPEPPLKKTDLSDALHEDGLQKPAIVLTSSEPVSKEPETSPALSEPGAKTPSANVRQSDVNPKECVSQTPAQKEVKNTELKNETQHPKPLKPLPSPKFFKREGFKPFKSSHSRRISCDEEMLTDATDAEKSELKRARSNSSSGLTLSKRHGSSTSLNFDGSREGKQDKALDFLKKQTQRLKGFLGPKGEKKGVAEDKTMHTVAEVSEDSSPKTESLIPGKAAQTESTATVTEEKGEKLTKPSSSRYQSSANNILYSSNLRDDTKAILEQISANSQKSRMEAEKLSPGKAEEAKEDAGGKHAHKEAKPSITYLGGNRFQRVQANTHERDSLLKRIESMRKEKKVYSRFEMGNTLG